MLPGRPAPVPDSTAIAQKIISCVYRAGQNFGAAHIADILRGSQSQRILERRHDQLSTFGLLRGTPRPCSPGT
jgi:ATP-dependent DNA helicase RecQ